MAKNKGTHGKGAEPAHEPDEFVQKVTSFGDVIQPHIKKIVAVGVLALLALSAWKFMDWRHDKKAKSATQAYVSAMKIVDAPIVAADEKKSDDESLSFVSEEARQEAGLAAFAKLNKDYGDISLSKLAGSSQARLLLDAGRYDEALVLYKKFAASTAPEPLRLAALESVGYTLEAKAMASEDAAARQAGLETALRAFEQLQTKGDGPMHDYSLYHQGRLLVEMGKIAEGIAKFKAVLSEHPDSALTVSIENRLATLDVGE